MIGEAWSWWQIILGWTMIPIGLSLAWSILMWVTRG